MEVRTLESVARCIRQATPTYFATHGPMALATIISLHRRNPLQPQPDNRRLFLHHLNKYDFQIPESIGRFIRCLAGYCCCLACLAIGTLASYMIRILFSPSMGS